MRPLNLRLSAFCAYAGIQEFDFVAGLGGHRLFLIHGSTGAGKTSILDGLCYALFGQSSGQERGPGHLRSQHAEAATRTEVTLDFALGSARYRILRRAEWQRPSRRGGGTVAEEGGVTLWRLEDQPVLMADGERNVAPVIESLLGYRAAEFRQVVVLPQGRFRELLTASPRDRQEILSRLFRTSLYRRIAQELQDRARAGAEALKRAETRRETLLGQAGATSAAEAEAARNVLADQAATAHIAQSDATQKATVARQALDAATRDAARLAEAAAASAALDHLLSEEPARTARRTLLDQSRQADRLRGDHAAWFAAQKNASRAAIEATQAAAAAQAAITARDTAASALATAPARTEAIANDQAEAARLTALVARAEEAAIAAQHRDATNILAQTTARTRETARTKAQSAAEALTAAAARHDSQAAIAAQRDRHALELGVATRQARDAARLAKLAAETARLRRDRAAAESEGKAAAETLRAAEAAEAEAAWALAADQAAHLATQLAPGAACPVCGATHHPAPAQPGEHGAGDVALLQAATTSARQALDAARERFATLRENMRTAMAEEAALAADLSGTATPDLPALTEARDRAEAAHAALPGLLRALDSARQATETTAQAQQKAETAAQKAATAATAGQQALDSLRAALPENLPTPDALRAAARQHADAAARGQKSLEADNQEATRSAAALLERASQAATATSTASTATAAEAEAAATLAAACRGAGFTDVAAFEAALLPAAEIAALATEVTAADDALTTARAQEQATSRAAQGLAAPDLPTLQAAAAIAETTKQDASRQAGALAEALASRDRLLADIAAAETDRAAAETAWKLREDLAKLADGSRNRQRINLEGFVLRGLLDEALSAANRRLRQMLAGRYTLRRVEEPERRNAPIGLDIEVLDEQTGQLRPAGTLSGGEGFCAALALALGLSDTVQANAGAQRIDALFIDEGFGTLDEEALENAIGVLAALQSGERLVGIISHVPELRGRIPARLEVSPGPRGSTAAFRVG